ncbi:MAG: hypothetical protein LR015_00005 [Verrucomicrobia bacterium]|nr:hypothetical protein [Verrucomicrobiota bacterium]
MAKIQLMPHLISAWSVSLNGTNTNVGPRLQGGLSYSGAPSSQGTAVALGRFGGSGAYSNNTTSRSVDINAMTSHTAYYGSFMFNMNESMYNAGAASSLHTRWSFQQNPLETAQVRNLFIGINGNNQLYMEMITNTSQGLVTSASATISGHTDTQLVVFRILDRTDPANTSGGTTEQITAWLNPNLSLPSTSGAIR